ncbi:hypothetical protein VTN02DRAFT_2833 [Thermoascus thermophilus]
MAPNLRLSSRARSSNSRPSTPLNVQAAVNSTSFTESTRPRKQRRTGRNSSVAVDPAQETAAEQQGHSEQPEDTRAESPSPPQSSGPLPEWVEPPLRAPAPSYRDTPWSGVSHDKNPVLATMRPLGAMPTASDLRKVGLAPTKAPARPVARKRSPKEAGDGENEENGNERPKSASTSAEELTRSASPQAAGQRGLPEREEQIRRPTRSKSATDNPGKDAADANGTRLAGLPVPTSTEYNVEKIKSAVESALRMADDTGNRAVIRGLRRIWEESSSDPFLLSVLDGVVKQNPGPRQRFVFQTVMRDAFKSVKAETQSASAPMARTRSATSTSSLSSAKSLDAETFAPGMEPGAGKPTGRAKGKSAKPAAAKGKEGKDKDKGLVSEPLSRRSAFPPSDAALQRKRALEEDPNFSEEAIEAKRSRLRRTFSEVVPRESRIRSSLSRDLGPNLSSPAGSVGSTRRSRAERDRAAVNGVEATSANGDGTPVRPARRPTLSRDETIENNDFCRQCGRSGQLLCCDGCVNSYHFSCLSPPLDPANPPEGQWFCPSCSMSGPLGILLGDLEKAPQRDFLLSEQDRNYFEGVRTGEGGKYEEVATNFKAGARGRGNRTGRADEQYLLRLFDNKGKLIVCVACGRTSNGVRPIIQCDYCPCSWHMDCVDPPLVIPPVQKPGSDKTYHNWMCPNHPTHELYTVASEEGEKGRIHRIRRPRNPRVIDVDVLPDDSEVERLEEQESQGIVYRVSEKGIKLNFIERVKRENLEAEIRARGAAQYSEYAKKKLDELVSKATEFYASQPPGPQVFDNADAAASILGSRSAAEREAAVNLVSFAQQNRDIENLEPDKISLLIDQLKANAPKHVPKPNTELESLRALQELINRRIERLTAETAAEPTNSN